jgi:hypothetical protein
MRETFLPFSPPIVGEEEIAVVLVAPDMPTVSLDPHR